MENAYRDNADHDGSAGDGAGKLTSTLPAVPAV